MRIFELLGGCYAVVLALVWALFAGAARLDRAPAADPVDEHARTAMVPFTSQDDLLTGQDRADLTAMYSDTPTAVPWRDVPIVPGPEGERTDR